MNGANFIGGLPSKIKPLLAPHDVTSFWRPRKHSNRHFIPKEMEYPLKEKGWTRSQALFPFIEKIKV